MLQFVYIREKDVVVVRNSGRAGVVEAISEAGHALIRALDDTFYSWFDFSEIEPHTTK